MTNAREEKPAYHVLIVKGKNFNQTVFLEHSTYSIGRLSNSSIVLPFESISRRHATIIRKKIHLQSDSYWIVDGDLEGKQSKNGVAVNQKKCIVRELKHGDTIEFASELKAYYYIVSNLELVSKLAPLEAEPAPRQTAPPIAKKQYQPTLISADSLEKRDREELLRLASFPELSPSPIVEVSWDGNIVYLNPAASNRFPTLYEQRLKHPILSGLLPQESDGQGKLLVREVKIGQKVFEQYIHYLPERQLVRSYIFDFTERKQTEIALQESEKRYRAVIRQTREGIFLVDAATKQILEANAAYCHLLGYNLEETLELALYDVVALDREIVELKLQQLLVNQQDFVEETRHCRKDGSLVSVEVSVSLISYYKKEMFCFVVRDITERKRFEERLQYQASHDSLTGLPNRTLFNEQLSTALANASRHRNLMAVMFLDLDRFKSINDTLGHGVGDLLLQEFATLLKSCLRAGDTIARWGGDEFTVLLPTISGADEAANISKRILKALTQPFQLGEHQLNISSSIGIALYPEDGTEAESLLKRADAALYRIKEEGRNNYGFYQKRLQE